MTYEGLYCYAAVQHQIIDTNKLDAGIGSIDTLVSVSPITSNQQNSLLMFSSGHMQFWNVAVLSTAHTGMTTCTSGWDGEYNTVVHV